MVSCELFVSCKMMNYGDNVIKINHLILHYGFVKLYQFLNQEKKYVLSKQLLRSGTAIGALVREAEQTESPN